MPRSFIDASAVDEPLEWSTAPGPSPAVYAPPPPPPAPGIEVDETGQVETADVEFIVALHCPRCSKRALWPAAAYAAAPRFHVCNRCRAAIELPPLPGVRE
jgi:hypothetical protein